MNVQLPMGRTAIDLLYGALSDEDRDVLLELDSGHEFFIEIAPYALLHMFSWTFTSSWLVDIQKRSGSRTVSPRMDVDKERVTIEDVDISGEPVQLNQLSFNPIDVLTEHKADFYVPPDTRIELEYGQHADRSHPTLRLEKPGGFLFTFECRSRSSGPGLPLGHPLGGIYSSWDTPRDRLEDLSDQLASIEIDINFEADLAFPDVRDTEFEKHHAYAETFIDLLQDRWDADAYLEELPHGQIFRIEDKIDQLIEHLSRTED